MAVQIIAQLAQRCARCFWQEMARKASWPVLSSQHGSTVSCGGWRSATMDV